MGDEEEIKSYVTSYLNDLSTLDIENMRSHFSKDIQCFLIGTAENEIFRSFEDVKENIQTQISLGVTYKELYPEFINLEVRNKLAWCCYYLYTTINVNGDGFSFRFRVTLILEKVDNKWYVRQSHGSAPQSGVEEGQSLPSIMGIQEQITHWINNFEVSREITAAEEKKQTELRSYLMKARDIAQSMEAS
ncbi:MAG: hypothetical protein HeimC2_01280 [Candidatus Heimdallarchaeota archaeon LC_2]|nr:MAG: hypothetical protein HeimC2_01280 [Candidatus Heimdallarchaeota archaeon LC_2]